MGNVIDLIKNRNLELCAKCGEELLDDKCECYGFFGD